MVRKNQYIEADKKDAIYFLDDTVCQSPDSKQEECSCYFDTGSKCLLDKEDGSTLIQFVQLKQKRRFLTLDRNIEGWIVMILWFIFLPFSWHFVLTTKLPSLLT